MYGYDIHPYSIFRVVRRLVLVEKEESIGFCAYGSWRRSLRGMLPERFLGNLNVRSAFHGLLGMLIQTVTDLGSWLFAFKFP
jgi:hypothetical protein